jgi:hypothetical protein
MIKDKEDKILHKAQENDLDEDSTPAVSGSK